MTGAKASEDLPDQPYRPVDTPAGSARQVEVDVLQIVFAGRAARMEIKRWLLGDCGAVFFFCIGGRLAIRTAAYVD